MEVAPGEKQPWESNQKEHCNIDCLVVTGTMEWMMTFPSLGIYFIIPTDFHFIIFQRGRLLKTTNQLMSDSVDPNASGRP